MYRLLLCFRYLRTRYIALASIISVTLGVATLIVVNSVMAGFSAEMHQRLHGLASDILIECHTSGGMPDPDHHLRRNQQSLRRQNRRLVRQRPRAGDVGNRFQWPTDHASCQFSGR